MYDERRSAGIKLGTDMLPDIFRWAFSETTSSRGATVTACWIVGFVLCSGALIAVAEKPELVLEHGQKYESLLHHSRCTVESLENERWHTLVTHSLMFPAVWYGLLLIGCWACLGKTVESHVGGFMTLVLFGAAIVANAKLQIELASPNELVQEQVQHVISFYERTTILHSPPLDKVVSDVESLESKRKQTVTVFGPLAGIYALISAALIFTLHRSFEGNRVLTWFLAAGFVIADCGEFLLSKTALAMVSDAQASSVARFSGTMCGLAVGVLVSVVLILQLMVTSKHKPETA